MVIFWRAEEFCFNAYFRIADIRIWGQQPGRKKNGAVHQPELDRRSDYASTLSWNPLSICGSRRSLSQGRLGRRQSGRHCKTGLAERVSLNMKARMVKPISPATWMSYTVPYRTLRE